MIHAHVVAVKSINSAVQRQTNVELIRAVGLASPRIFVFIGGEGDGEEKSLWYTALCA